MQNYGNQYQQYLATTQTMNAKTASANTRLGTANPLQELLSYQQYSAAMQPNTLTRFQSATPQWQAAQGQRTSSSPLSTSFSGTPAQQANNFGTFNTGTGGAGSLSPQSMLDALLKARPQFVQQQQQLLNQYGTTLRNSILHASPELSAAANFYNQRFTDPLGGMESEYAGRLRTAQAARGFGGGGTGPTGEEARFLQGLAEESRRQLLPGMQQFGGSVLGLSGLGPPDYSSGQFLNTFSDIYGANLRNQQFQQNLGFEQGQYQDTLAANQQQSQFAQQYYTWLQQQIQQQYGGGPNYANNLGQRGQITSSPYTLRLF